MCGFAGFLSASAVPGDAVQFLNRMGDAIRHRGPDDAGVCIEPSLGAGLVHRRLAIVDLSSAGRQPMESPRGRYVIAFNGEIYNHLELREWVESESESFVAWRGHSDTESILFCIEVFGLQATLRRAVGMFSLALLDRTSSTVSFARDRMGEKPLYYGLFGETVVFGSELHALRQHPLFRSKISRGSLSLFVRLGYVPAPLSIYDGIRKLSAGSLLTISRRELISGRLPQEEVYWSVDEIAENCRYDDRTLTDARAVDTLNKLILDSVRIQRVSDVPLGAFLSGGVDSSLVAAALQSQSTKPIDTFTVGFDEAAFDESAQASLVARHIGTNHHEIYVRGDDARKLIPELAGIYDEPFADSSQIPTRVICQYARRSVTVALSGDGGDELFGGYVRHIKAAAIWKRLAPIPAPLRRIIAMSMGSVPIRNLERIYQLVRRGLPSNLQFSQPSEKLAKLMALLMAEDERSLYWKLISQWDSTHPVLMTDLENLKVRPSEARWPRSLDFTEWMMLTDAKTYLPDDVLVKLDRAAMSVSLETRVPLLDHRVVEFAFSLPLRFKIRDGEGKWILRRVLDRYVPQELVNRPKSGFAVPIGDWLRGPLRDWAECLLSAQRLESEGFFDANIVRRRWEEHLLQRRDWHYSLWNVIVFQAWLANSVEGAH